VSKFIIKQTDVSSKTINIPIELKWDYLGQDVAIDEYQEKIVDEVIGEPRDFEVNRFSHKPYGETNKTEINYEFYFYSGGSLDQSTNWNIDYRSEGFSPRELYYYENSFRNSFFKLDFYDTKDEKTQKNYITIILPTQQGLTMDAIMQRTPVVIKKPKFVLDYVGDKEGFFIYWLKSKKFLDIDKFYMSAKFFNAKTGEFVRMINSRGPQSKLGDKYNFKNDRFFYYDVELDYEKQTYEIIEDDTNSRIGTTTPIKWYEYVNPQ
jgi:hypothetical protein